MVTWSHEADKRLLVEIYSAGPSSIDWEDVARRFGDGCTVQAIRQHIRVLKRQIEASSKETSVAGSGVSKAKRAGTGHKPLKGDKEQVDSDIEDSTAQSDEN
ncbi:Small-subunit processome Utp12 [Penicillium atrosanguineum]|uniref:Small-subunit processome Utp12 n=1 Tax=Penicillium atrosanguineum TaxID=1132637 RepID=UPI0023883629|nr:Small-subunit processome Utp12 [Penicillium atrosanguineum]KAJ5290656.1 Small-subunit processome Utp12 [Penicillium atrosanguineum]